MDKAKVLNSVGVKEATDIKGEVSLIEERLAKLEKTRQDFSEAVYQKVKEDYQKRLSTAKGKLQTLKEQLGHDLQAILQHKKSLQQEYQKHQEALEEARLRSSLGEHTEEQFKKIEGEEKTFLKELEEKIHELEGEEGRFTTLFGSKPELPKHPSQPDESDTAKVKMAVKERSLSSKGEPKPEDTEPHGGKVEAGLPEGSKLPQIVHMEKDKIVEKFPIDKTIEIGRSPANHIVLNEPKVSRRHAEIQYVGGKYVLVDLQSSNGTYVKGKKIKEYTLQPNDEIRIGNTILIFQP